MSNSANVTIPYSEFEKIQDARKEAQAEAADLRKQLTKVRVGASDLSAIAVARAALEIVRYAVGSMPAESNIGWPSQALRDIAGQLQFMPDVSQDDVELATTLIYFANEVDLYERRRQGIAKAQLEMPLKPKKVDPFEANDSLNEID